MPHHFRARACVASSRLLPAALRIIGAREVGSSVWDADGYFRCPCREFCQRVNELSGVTYRHLGTLIESLSPQVIAYLPQYICWYTRKPDLAGRRRAVFLLFGTALTETWILMSTIGPQ